VEMVNNVVVGVEIASDFHQLHRLEQVSCCYCKRQNIIQWHVKRNVHTGLQNYRHDSITQNTVYPKGRRLTKYHYHICQLKQSNKSFQQMIAELFKSSKNVTSNLW